MRQCESEGAQNLAADALACALSHNMLICDHPWDPKSSQLGAAVETNLPAFSGQAVSLSTMNSDLVKRVLQGLEQDPQHVTCMVDGLDQIRSDSTCSCFTFQLET